MGILDWLFRRKKISSSEIAIEVKPDIPKLSIRIETGFTPVAYDIFSSEIAGSPIKAEIPSSEIKSESSKESRIYYDDGFPHDGRWASVYYKGERHGYLVDTDIWSHSARPLPELPLIHAWIYSILGERKAKITGNLKTAHAWQDRGVLYAQGTYEAINVRLSFKPRGFILRFTLSDGLRFEEKATYNRKTGQSDFPFYYSDIQGKIIAWANAIFEEKRFPGKKT